MEITKARFTVELDSKCYFWVGTDSERFRVTLTDGGKQPVHFDNVSHKQLHQLITACNKALADYSEQQIRQATLDRVCQQAPLKPCITTGQTTAL